MDYAAQVSEAVQRFYTEGNNEVHMWLLKAQATPEAWTFVWQLLDPSKSGEVQFFAASTLHAKISRQWNEVPQAEYPVLHERLLSCMKQPNAPKIVLGKLCQALAGFLAKSGADEGGGKDKNLVDDLVEMFPYNSPVSLELLLRVLTALPIEFEKRQSVRRNGAGEGIINCWRKTSSLLEQTFTMCDPNSENNNITLYFLALECTLSWLQHLLHRLPLDTTGPIYPHLLVAASHFAPSRDRYKIDNSKAWEIVQECLILILTNDELHRKPLTLWEWSYNLVVMATMHKTKYFCEILAAMGDANSREFLVALTEEGNEKRKWTAEGLIELMLQCSEQEGRYPTEETRSSIPFTFWFSLQDYVLTLDSPVESQALQALKPIYARLAQALLRKTTLPLSAEEAGDADERELFRCYRQSAADTFLYCYNVLKYDLLMVIGQRLSQPMNSPENWAEVEATLHALEALADDVETEESKYIPALFELLISHIPYDIYPDEVLASACSTIRAYAYWIGQHPGPWLEKVLRIVTVGLTRSNITGPLAGMALKDLARECGPHLAPFAPSILNVISDTLPKMTPGSRESLQLMYVAGKLLNTLPSVDEQWAHLGATMGQCFVKIRELLEQPLFIARTAVTNQLKMMTTFFSQLEGTIGKAVLEALLPIFKRIIEHPEWSQDYATLEAMHTCAMKSLSSLANPEVDAKPLLPILATSYQKWPHPAALNLLRQLVLLFGRDSDNAIGAVFADISLITLSIVRTCRSVGGDLSDWSDLLEAYLALLAQVCKKSVRIPLQVSDQIPEMLQCGIVCLMVPEIPTVKAAGYFLSNAIMKCSHFQTFIQPIGQELVSVILRCVGGEVPRNNLQPHADILTALNKICPDWTVQWLRVALQEKTGVASTTEAQRETFARNVLRERRSNGMVEILKEFSLLCIQPSVGL